MISFSTIYSVKPKKCTRYSGGLNIFIKKNGLTEIPTCKPNIDLL